MSARSEEGGAEASHERSPRWIAPWKRVLLALAALSVVGGLALSAGSKGGAPAERGAPPPAAGAGALTTSLLPQGETPPGGGAPSESAEPAGDDWSPLFVKGGFGFFAGFCIGYALRAFFKVSAIVAGVVLLALFGLQQLGAVQIEWDVLSDLYERAATAVSGELESLHAAVTGSLPAAGLAGFGLFAGFKRTR